MAAVRCGEDIIVKFRYYGRWHVVADPSLSMTWCGRRLPVPWTGYHADEVPSRDEWCRFCRNQVDWQFEQTTEWAIQHGWLSISKVRR